MTLRRLVEAISWRSAMIALLVAVWSSSATAATFPLTSDVDPALSSVSATPLSGALANGLEEVEVQVVVRDVAGAPLAGQVVRIHSSQPADQIAQPVAPTDAQGRALASLATEVEGARTLWAVVDPDGAAIELGTTPLVHFEPQPVQPNFLIILLDDIGTDSLALYDEVNPYKSGSTTKPLASKRAAKRWPGLRARCPSAVATTACRTSS